MPTGYTCEIANGITFEKFALLCARAFGATIMMRDEPLDSEIPTFVASDFHEKQIAAARADMEKVRAMSNAECAMAALNEFLDAIENNKRLRMEYRELRTKYEAMLESVRAWQPPTPDHNEMKSFMEKQILDSIEWDCDEKFIVDPLQLSGEDWRINRIERAQKCLDQSLVEHAKEVERTQKRNDWVSALRNSLT